MFLIAGKSLELTLYSITGNSRCERLKSCQIGQSAAKSPEQGERFNDYLPQRWSREGSPSRNGTHPKWMKI